MESKEIRSGKIIQDFEQIIVEKILPDFISEKYLKKFKKDW
jgi:hypothetical protein